MCRRYVTPSQVSIDQEFDLVRTDWEFRGSFNVAPGSVVPVIRVIDDQPDTVLLHWGFGDPITFTVPVEMVNPGSPDSGFMARGQRCIVPALGFYEWRIAGGVGRRPYYIHPEDQNVCGFAGFWERDSCLIVTLPANDERTPVILAREMRDVWLYGSSARAAAALQPYPESAMMAYVVSARVDSLQNDDEKLIEPMSTDVD